MNPLQKTTHQIKDAILMLGGGELDRETYLKNGLIYGTVKRKEIKVALTEAAQRMSKRIFKAPAIDENGNKYQVIWKTTEWFNSNEESFNKILALYAACDWQTPNAIKEI